MGLTIFSLRLGEILMVFLQLFNRIACSGFTKI